MENQFQCMICYDIAENPYLSQCNCRNLYCQQHYQQMKGKKCPTCNNYPEIMEADIYLKRVIGNLEKKCDSCGFVTTVSEFSTHEQKCPYKVIQKLEVKIKQLEQENASLTSENSSLVNQNELMKQVQIKNEQLMNENKNVIGFKEQIQQLTIQSKIDKEKQEKLQQLNQELIEVVKNQQQIQNENNENLLKAILQKGLKEQQLQNEKNTKFISKLESQYKEQLQQIDTQSVQRESKEEKEQLDYNELKNIFEEEKEILNNSDFKDIFEEDINETIKRQQKQKKIRKIYTLYEMIEFKVKKYFSKPINSKEWTLDMYDLYGMHMKITKGINKTKRPMLEHAQKKWNHWNQYNYANDQMVKSYYMDLAKKLKLY